MSKAYDKVKLARANNRPVGRDFIDNIFSGFFELHGDRRFADDAAICAGVAYLGKRPVTVIAIDKGRSTRERMLHNFGAPNPEGYRKALRLMKQAEKFHRPVICFVDTSGAYCGIEAEERGQGQAIAENLVTLMGLKMPVISVLTGEGGSGGALALAVADEVWMLENAIYSVISPEGCASILWKDAAKAAEAAESLHLTAADALALEVADRVIPETDLGKEPFYEALRRELGEKLDELSALSEKELTDRRYARFRALGTKQLIGE
ncbi:MAG: acetyl-CoA carboxylase carboxyltransferase subunit alpha [Oscillospiraceae bacterium]|nr:acetyl-CoA carboxylase carboxyltransferase subunit alpha [Oscillospiraceae bacterium]